MKNSGAIALFTSLILAIVWWNWPDWGRWEYWLPEVPGTVSLASCRQGQLTTLGNSSTISPSWSPVALTELAAHAIFEEPPYKSELAGRVSKRLMREEQLVMEGRAVRVPANKLVRYVQPSELAACIVEVEVFRHGDEPLRGFVRLEDLGCYPFDACVD
jgi:hypothetical protein